MTDDKDMFALEAPPESVPFLANDSRDTDGNMLFAKLNEPIEFEVLNIDLFTDQKGKTKPSLVLQYEDGKEFLFVLGVMSQQELAVRGFTNAKELVGKTISIQTYQTGSTGKFSIGKEITDVE